ncbi:hypothetical protein GS421_17075 [Rhodococcus hoagii]|nr:hypothetical protein [Prescottella equi]
MKIIDRIGPAFAAFVGAFVAGFAILASEPNDTIALEGDGGIWLHTTLQWAATAPLSPRYWCTWRCGRRPVPLRLQLLSGSPRRRGGRAGVTARRRSAVRS